MPTIIDWVFHSILVLSFMLISYNQSLQIFISTSIKLYLNLSSVHLLNYEFLDYNVYSITEFMESP